MNTALIYRPSNHRLTWVAFECAVTIYLTAIALAENKPKPVIASFPESFDPGVVGIDNTPPQSQEQEVTPAEQSPSVTDNDFYDVNPTPRPIRPHKKSQVTPVAQSIGTGTAAASHAGAVKALTLYAPKPSYPYEARRGGVTGSGVAQLTVNSATGNVVDARVAQSTGNAILDNATVNTLRRWRFKPGVAESVDVPITFTLSGVSY